MIMCKLFNNTHPQYIHNSYNKVTTQFTNGQRTFCKVSIEIVNKYKDTHLPSLVIKEIQVKTTLRPDRVHMPVIPGG